MARLDRATQPPRVRAANVSFVVLRLTIRRNPCKHSLCTLRPRPHSFQAFPKSPPVMTPPSATSGASCTTVGSSSLRPSTAMRRFRAARGPVVLVSNAPRPPEGVIALFDKLDIPRDFYDAIVTSGGEAREDLIRRTAGGKRLKLFYLGPARDHPLFEGLNIELTEAEKAELVLCTGFYDDETETPDDYRELLDDVSAAEPSLPVRQSRHRRAARRQAHLLRRRDRARSTRAWAARSIYYGKPYEPIFVAATCGNCINMGRPSARWSSATGWRPISSAPIG